MTLTSLIDEIQSATTGSVYLDIAIARQAGWLANARFLDGGETMLAFAEKHAREKHWQACLHIQHKMGLPNYTSCIDDKLPIEDEGFVCVEGKIGDTFFASLGTDDGIIEARASTEALARRSTGLMAIRAQREGTAG